jgi:hypothetical protein
MLIFKPKKMILYFIISFKNRRCRKNLNVQFVMKVILLLMVLKILIYLPHAHIIFVLIVVKNFMTIELSFVHYAEPIFLNGYFHIIVETKKKRRHALFVTSTML